MLGRLHHISLTCSNLNVSLNFYRSLGFISEKRYDDDSCSIVLLKGNIGKIELFYFFDNTEPLKKNNIFLKQIGITHIAFCTDDIKKARKECQNRGICCSKITFARLKGFFYFFIQDPDGNQIEFIEDII